MSQRMRSQFSCWPAAGWSPDADADLVRLKRGGGCGRLMRRRAADVPQVTVRTLTGRTVIIGRDEIDGVEFRS